MCPSAYDGLMQDYQLPVSAMPQGPEASRKAMRALMEALTTQCECKACKILRSMAEDLKAELEK